MCSHRPSGKWGRIWAHWIVAAVGSFVVLEATGIATEGTRGTLSAYLRHLAGLDPRCHHGHLGRLILVSICGWAVAHLGWGLFGFLPHSMLRNFPVSRCRRQSC